MRKYGAGMIFCFISQLKGTMVRCLKYKVERITDVDVLLQKQAGGRATSKKNGIQGRREPA
jgi:hypothetical protein